MTADQRQPTLARWLCVSALHLRVLAAGVVLASYFAISVASLLVKNPALPVALWWPASGVAVIAMLIVRNKVWAALAIVVLATVANVMGDRPVELAIAYGALNALEAFLVVWFATRDSPHVRLDSLRAVTRYLLSVAGAVAIFSAFAAAAAAFIVRADWVSTALSLSTSHASAILVIATIAIVPLRGRLRLPAWEPWVQVLAFIVITAVVFAPPNALPLSFLVLAPLLWAAYRLPPFVFAVQVLALGVFSTTATFAGNGAFALLLANDARLAVLAVQLFLITHAAAAMLVLGQSTDAQRALADLAQREQEALSVAEELRRLSAQQDDFIATVSHELRTPVTSIIGFAEQLRESALPPDAVQAAEIVERNAHRLADLVDDVLELSAVAGAPHAEPAVEVDLVRELPLLASSVGGATADERIRLHSDIDSLVVTTRPRALERVLANVLSNALKFSPGGAGVDVSLNVDGDHVVITIQDSGIGIPPAELDAVWERFYRVDTERHRAVPGTGLGLPIVRALTRGPLEGDVDVYSDGESGVTVTIRLPLTTRSRFPTTRPIEINGGTDPSTPQAASQATG